MGIKLLAPTIGKSRHDCVSIETDPIGLILLYVCTVFLGVMVVVKWLSCEGLILFIPCICSVIYTECTIKWTV